MDEKQIKLLWTYKETAQRLSITVQALRDWVYKGHGPITVRIGNRTFFKPSDVEQFVNEHREVR